MKWLIFRADRVILNVRRQKLMTVPEPLWRFPTREAIARLASRFDVPNEPHMQDWEWEVADPSRLDEYLKAYNGAELSDDERFTLMETIIRAFDDLPVPLDADERWQVTLSILDENIDLHAYSVWYWSDLEYELSDETWRVTPFLRKLVQKHQGRLDPQSGSQDQDGGEPDDARESPS
ncbi:hypothetical protein RBSWK_06258 [Rhodopirellula baltica SWK14]|uniref:Uncharacterized protein n=1 Tax=Rhodopirellula baltica SWK14 TaxID=993516 RepID=L7C7Z8_RHOBT|nr:hypothetical protein RBSWK_06258 [Rhodopirellula baltica SWK14]